jgi:cytoskeleton protein RodZ
VSTDLSAGAGSKLRAAREGMEVAPGEVADALNLPVNVIEALEADDFQSLPPTVFTRGYLRSYARLLELEPEEILALYPDAQENTETQESMAESATLLDQPGLKLAGIAAAVVVVLVVLLVWLFSGGGEDEVAQGEAGVVGLAEASGPKDTASPATEIESSTAGVEQSLNSEIEIDDNLEHARISENEGLTETVEPETAGDEQVQPLDPPASDSAPAFREKPDPTTAAPESNSTRRITEFGDDVLQLTFVDECWVEVKSTAGDNLYSDLSRAGATLTLEGRGPFRILLGYAPAVSMTFNGEPVTLAPHTRNNVATLVLGQ